MKTRIQILLLTVLAFFGLATSSRSAVDMFLKLDGVKGESIAVGHEEAIDILSFSFGASQRGLMLAGGVGGPAKSDFHTLTVFKDIDKATPLLMLSCALGSIPGTSHPTAILSFSDDTRKNNPEFFQITLTNVIVSSFNEGNASTSGGAGGDTPIESVSFSFQKIEFKYTPDSVSATPIKATYDVKANKGS